MMRWVMLAMGAMALGCNGPEKRDTDLDGLTDAQEERLGTDPLRPDTDGDRLKDGEEVGTTLTDPLRADTDGDLLDDGDEVLDHGTDPLEADSDGGGVDDGVEVAAGTDPLDPSDDPTLMDRDEDGLSDAEETLRGTDPLDADTDDDELTDGDEVYTYLTSPLDPDTDDDGLTDGDEVQAHQTDPLDDDTDDGLATDGFEIAEGTDPLDPADDATILDRDADGLTDAEENALGTDLLDPDSDDDLLSDGDEVILYYTDPLDADSDDDTLTDGDEVLTHKTDPLNPDTDGGLATDDHEIAEGTDPLDASDDATILDRDSDGLTDAEEYALGTDPLDDDTDADGLTDYDEVTLHKTDPLIADTDDDALVDGDEVDVHFTDPLLRDTDYGGLPDGYEVNALLDPLDASDDDPTLLRLVFEDFEGGEQDAAIWDTQTSAVAYDNWYTFRGDYALQVTGTGRATTPVIDTSACSKLYWSFRSKRGPDPAGAADSLRLQYWDGSIWRILKSHSGGATDTSFERFSGVARASAAFHDAFQLELEHTGPTVGEGAYYVDDLLLWCDVDEADSDGDDENNTVDCDPSNADHWFDCGVCIDDDGDGYGVDCDLGADCNDGDAGVNPDAIEVNGDGVDDNCDGFDDANFMYDDFDAGDWDAAVWDTVVDSEVSVIGRGHSLEMTNGSSALSFTIDTSGCTEVVVKARVRRGPNEISGWDGLTFNWENSTGTMVEGLKVKAEDLLYRWYDVYFSTTDATALHSAFRVEVEQPGLGVDEILYLDEVGFGCTDADSDGDGRPFAADCAPDDANHWADCGYCTDADGDDFGASCDLGGDCDEVAPLIYDGAPDDFGDGIDQDCSGYDGPSFHDDFEAGPVTATGNYRQIDVGFSTTTDESHSGDYSLWPFPGVSKSALPHIYDLSSCPEVVWYYWAKRDYTFDSGDKIIVTMPDVGPTSQQWWYYGTSQTDAAFVRQWGTSGPDTDMENFALSLRYWASGEIYIDDFGFACYDPANDDGDGIPPQVDCAPDDGAHWADCGLCTDNDGDDYGVDCDLGVDCDDTDGAVYPDAYDTFGDGLDANCDGFDGVGLSDDFETGTLEADVWQSATGDYTLDSVRQSEGTYSLELEGEAIVQTVSLDTTPCPEILWYFDGQRGFPAPERGDDLVVSWWDGAAFVDADTPIRGNDAFDDADHWPTRWGVIDDPAAFHADFKLQFDLVAAYPPTDNRSDAFGIDDFAVVCADLTLDEGDGVPDLIDCDDTDANHWFDCGNCTDADGDGHGVGCDLGEDCDDTSANIHPSATDPYDDGVDDNCDGVDGVGWSEDFDGTVFDEANWLHTHPDFDLSTDFAVSGTQVGKIDITGHGTTTAIDTTVCDEVLWYYTGRRGKERTRHAEGVALELYWWDGTDFVLGDSWPGAVWTDYEFVRRWGTITDPAALHESMTLLLERKPDQYGTWAAYYIDDFGFACSDAGTDGDGVPNPIDCDPDSGAHWFDCDVCTDDDADDYGEDCDLGPDCDDTDDTIYPGATETAGDTIDSDCSGKDDDDQSTGFDSGTLEAPLQSTSGEVVFSTTESKAGAGSMELKGYQATAESQPFDASGCTDGVEYSYYVKRGSSAPKDIDSLYFEYWDGTTWVPQAVHRGTGFGDTDFTWFVGLVDDPAAQHAGFRWRFRRHTEGYISGSFFVDEMYLQCGTDADGDGVSSTVDCDEADAKHWSDCTTCVDSDGDDYGADCDLGPDCDDADAAVSPGATDTFGDGTDTDCSGYDGPGFLEDFEEVELGTYRWEWVDGDVELTTKWIEQSGTWGLSFGGRGLMRSVPIDTSTCPDVVWYYYGHPAGSETDALYVDYWNGTEWVRADTWSTDAWSSTGYNDLELRWGMLPADAAHADFQFEMSVTYDGEYTDHGFDDIGIACTDPDADGDGVPEVLDCDDADAQHWFDCADCTDSDGDGFGTDCDLGLDCDDTDATVYPGAADALGDGVDTDCSDFDGVGIFDDFETRTFDVSRWTHDEIEHSLWLTTVEAHSGTIGLQIATDGRIVTAPIDTSSCGDLVWYFHLLRDDTWGGQDPDKDLVVSYWDGASYVEVDAITADTRLDPEFYFWWGTIDAASAYHPDFKLELAAVADPDDRAKFWVDDLGVHCSDPDVDGDGVPEHLDCDDNDAYHWFDCDVCVDSDLDDYGTDCDLGTDCDDTDATIYTGATDAYGDAIDADCSGEDGQGIFDDFDAAFGDSVDTTSGTAVIHSSGVNGDSARLADGILTFVPMNLNVCTDVVWEMYVLRGPTDAPDAYDEIKLQVEDLGTWITLWELPGNGTQETDFTHYSGTITDLRWVGEERTFRLFGDGSGTTVDDFLVDEFALGCDDDGDGLPDPTENLVHSTDPADADTDGDGFDDGVEVANGTDPLNPFSN